MAKIIRKIKRFLPFALLFIFAFLLYSFRLNLSPVHLNQDELQFSLNGYSISKSLKDEYGHFLPFYFWHLDAFWATPIITYLEALFLLFLPLSEVTTRLPSVLVGSLTVLLISLLTQKIFLSKKYSLIALVLAILSPAIFIHSRLLLDNLYLVPFVLLWLIFLDNYFKKRKNIYLFLSGLFLGIGIHSYHAAKIYMSVYFLITAIFVYEKNNSIWKKLAILFTGFIIPIIIFVPWLRKYPDTLTNQINYVSSIDSSIDSKKTIDAILNAKRVKQIASSYLSYFSPNILFVSGDRSLVHSTGNIGAFPFFYIFFFVFGLLEIIFKTKDKISKVLLLCFLAYPLAPSLINDQGRISRALVVIPFVILISVYGVKYLYQSKEKRYKFLFWSILVYSIFQFIFFIQYYFGDYRKVTYSLLNMNIGGGYEAILNSTKNRKVTNIYIDKDIPFAEKYWKYYQIKNNIYLDSTNMKFINLKEDSFSDFPNNSLILIYARKIRERKDWLGKFEKIEVLRESDGVESFYLYFRDK